MDSRERLFYLDNLKTALIMLVVAHHAGQPFGGGGFWYYKAGQSSEWFGMFFAVNAAFFMSLLFLISGYFVPASFDRKGPLRFTTDRLKRLGIPLLAGLLLIIPLLTYVYYINYRGYGYLSYWGYWINYYLGAGKKPINWTGQWPDLNFGHLWYIEHLLVYTLLYVAWRIISKRFSWSIGNNGKAPGHMSILLFTLVMATTTFAVRIWYSVDYWIGFLGVIQTEFAHVPIYVLSFIIGLIAYRRKWFNRLPVSIGKTWLGVGIISIVFFYASGYLNIMIFKKGGLNLYSLFRCIWESLVSVSIGVGLLVLFRERFNFTGRILQALADNSFSVYIIHVPILVVLQFALASAGLTMFSKFAIITISGITLSWLISHYVIRRIPYIKEIL